MTKNRSMTKTLAVLLVLALVMAFVPSGAKASAGDAISIATGEPLEINWTGTNTGSIVRVDSSSSYVPASFKMYVVGTATVMAGGVTILPDTSLDENGQTVTVYYFDGHENVYRYTIPTSTSGPSIIAVTISSNYYGDTGTYAISCPKRNVPTTTQYYPSDVNGYLPVGQFARPNSFGWGGIYTTGTNSGTTPKFLSGYVSTGVSLGMGGGYVQFDMGDAPIENDADNPYGVDFIVYGNAFTGNPEAASVQVSNDGTTWYELAGSKYYTMNREHVDHLSYIKIGADNTTISGKSFTKAGVYYSKNYVPNDSYNQNNDASGANTAIGNATWYCIPTASTLSSPVLASAANAATVSTSYWPEQGGTENYLNVWHMGTNGDKVGGVHWCRVGSAEVITYDNVNLVPDSDNAADYQFGYADVHNNGSSYGTVVNPYTVANDNSSGNTGGDGFDLAWAVDGNGTPVSLTSVKYIRVYSSVLFLTQSFGETSAEVCGLYVANGVGSGSATAPRLLDSGNNDVTISDMGNRTVTAGTYYITSSSSVVLVNGATPTLVTAGKYSLNVQAGTTYQIITQNGTESPFVTVITGV